MKLTIIALVVIVLFAVNGCNEKGEKTPDFLRSAAQLIEPMINHYTDPDMPMARYSTFAVLPKRVAAQGSASPAFGHELLEKQMLFLLRSHIESRGYRFVTDLSEADFIATIDGSNDYQTHYIPPSSVTVPTYVPSRTIVTNSYGSGSVHSHGTYGSAYGTYSGTSHSTTTIPGHWSKRTYEKPGRTVGHFYPVVSISMYDSESGQSVWYATSVGCSDNSDVRVSSQIPIGATLQNLLQSDTAAVEDNAQGSVRSGIEFTVFTPDGEAFYPMIVDVLGGSPAQHAKLRFGDLILAIDGSNAVNKSFDEVRQLLKDGSETQCVLTIAREGKGSFDVPLKRVER